MTIGPGPAFQRDPNWKRSKPNPRTGQEPKPLGRRRQPISPAHQSQRDKVRGESSIVSGQQPCDPAHITSRAHGGCDSPLCVIPLTREEHRLFDLGKLDVLGDMVARGMWAELAHAIEAHHVDPIALVNRLTGDRYVPERSHPEERSADEAA